MLEANYSWVHAALGGILIGLGSLLAAGASGKIPGISGIFSRLLRRLNVDTAWRAMFFIGLLTGVVLALALFESAGNFRPARSLGAMAIAGVLVGFGTRLGGGCTSGYGVCGLGLGSKTALVATVLFMAAGIVTVAALRYSGLAVGP
jgi:uncharacterized membrane protein YedE/YeeE